MKIKLLVECGLHKVGDIVDVDPIIVRTMELNGEAVIYSEDVVAEQAIKIKEPPKKKGNPNWGKR